MKKLESTFTDINTKEVIDFLNNPPIGFKKSLERSSPQLWFYDEAYIDAGYYDFEVDGLLFTDCRLRAFEKEEGKPYRYCSGSYYVRRINEDSGNTISGDLTITIPSDEDLDDDGNYIGSDPEFMENTAIELISKERHRQINVEGWTTEHDADHTDNSIAMAAVCYALPYYERDIDNMWPWDKKSWKPTPENRIKELIKAGALIVAEIDRLSAVENKKIK